MEFKNVTILKKANIYFGGMVTSRTILFEDGSQKTLGIMQKGEYEFRTNAKELMEIQSGETKVLLPESREWITVNAGQSFEVPAKSSFVIKVKTVTDYCCSYF